MNFYHIDTGKLRCPKCKSEMVPATAINGRASTSWYRCSDFNCKVFYDSSVPLPFQADILMDGSKRLGVFGGFGSGKTFTDYKGDEKHIMTTPSGETLIGADTLVQLENTVRKDFERDMPLEFVKSYNRQKNLITFINGHVLYYRPMSELGDVRSYNLSRAHLLEASGIKHEAYVELQSRMRNEAAIEYEKNIDGRPVVVWDKKHRQYRKKEKHNWIQMVMESNPDSGWIKQDVLLRSGRIRVHGETDSHTYEQNPNDILRFMTSHIIPTSANIYLPADFYDNMAAGKPSWWVRRFLRGSFDYSEGLVYPNWTNQIVEDFEIPNHWPRIIGFDYGLNDNSHFTFGALDINGEKGKPRIYFYAELVVNNMSISEISNEYKREIRRHVPPHNLYTMPRMDPKSFETRTRTQQKKTIGTLFQEEGCFFKPGEFHLEPRIMHLNDLINLDLVQFFRRGFAKANQEAMNYKFPEKKLEKATKNEDKPVDARNHGVNSTEFITSVVPKKFNNLQAGVMNIGNELVDSVRQPRLKRQWNPLEESAVEHVDTAEGMADLFNY